jgi:serine protease SohB
MKIALIVIGVLVLLVGLMLLMRARRKKKKFIQTGLKHPTGLLKYHVHTQTRLKKALSAEKADENAKAVATFSFKGDLLASERHSLSRLVDEIILNRERFSEVVVRVESPGGSVTDYGHVYAEMARIPQAGLKLSTCVDTVAASGGYLMCLPAQQIIAAPFSMVGSIGVVSFIPNVRKLLERFDVEPRTFTAGDYKRTVTMTDNATPEQVERYREQLNLIHSQFKQALARHRPHVQLEKVATGEAWLASTSLEKDLKLVDRLGVSADYLLELNRKQDLYEFSEQHKLPRFNRILRKFVDGALNTAHDYASKR